MAESPSHKFGQIIIADTPFLKGSSMDLDIQSYNLGHLGIVAGISVHGKYEKDAPDGTDSIRITFGHAKDGRKDLKRFVLGLVTNQFGLPLFTEAFSGNESDKKSIIKMIQKTQQAINLDDKSCWIADSALYTEDNIKLLGTGTKWITHVPATVGEAEKLLNADLDFTPGIVRSRYFPDSIEVCQKTRPLPV